MYEHELISLFKRTSIGPRAKLKEYKNHQQFSGPFGFGFLTLDSLFSVPQLQNSVQDFLMFVIYPQAAQTVAQHLTVDSIKHAKQTLYGRFPLLVLNRLNKDTEIKYEK